MWPRDGVVQDVYLLPRVVLPQDFLLPAVQPLPLSSDTPLLPYASVLIPQPQSRCWENSMDNTGLGPIVKEVYSYRNGPGLGHWSRCSEWSDWKAGAGSGRRAAEALPLQKSPAG